MVGVVGLLLVALIGRLWFAGAVHAVAHHVVDAESVPLGAALVRFPTLANPIIERRRVPLVASVSGRALPVSVQRRARGQ